MANIIRFRTSYVEPYPLQVEGESYLRKEIANLFPYLTWMMKASTKTTWLPA